jgi:hypothetical protein
MMNDVSSPQTGPRPLKKVGVLPLLGGILALSAEATIMVVLMVMAGVCALGSIIWWLIEKSNPKTWSKSGAGAKRKKREPA